MRKFTIVLLLLTVCLLAACSPAGQSVNTDTGTNATDAVTSVSPDESSTSQTEATPTPPDTTPVIITVDISGMSANPGCQGTVPQVYDKVIEYLKNHFDHSIVTDATIASSVISEEGKEDVERELPVTMYSVEVKKGDEEKYITLYYDSEKNALNSTLHEDEYLDQLSDNILKYFNIPAEKAECWAYFDYVDGVMGGLPESIETYDDFVKFVDPVLHSVSFGCIVRTEDFDANSILKTEYEKALAEFKLSTLSMRSVMNDVPDLINYHEYETVTSVNLYRTDGSTEDKINISLDVTRHGSMLTDVAKVCYDRDYIKFSSLRAVDIADVPSEFIKNDSEYTAYKNAIAFRAERVSAPHGDDADEEFTEYTNDFGGKTTSYKSNVYFALLFPRSEFNNLYTNLWGDMELYEVDADAEEYENYICIPLMNKNFDSSGVYEGYVVFYNQNNA